VTGRGGVTIRVRGSERVFPAGESFSIDLLRRPDEAQGTAPARSASVTAPPENMQDGPGSAADTASRHVVAFRAALGSRDVDGAVRAALALEQDAGDLAGPELAAARAELRSMISGLGDAAVAGLQDPREVVGPYVEAMLAVRATVRAEKRYDLSDVIRDAFEALGVEVRDTPSGVEWGLRA